MEDKLAYRKAELRTFTSFLEQAIDSCQRALVANLTDDRGYDNFCASAEDVRKWAEKVRTCKAIIRALEGE